jgi:ATP-binding cassette subfamily F protein uup
MRQASAATRAPAKQASTRPARPARQFGYNEKRELNALPRKIEALEADQAALHERMAEPDYFRTDPARMTEDREQLDTIARELEALYSRWEELESLRDADRKA